MSAFKYFFGLFVVAMFFSSSLYALSDKIKADMYLLKAKKSLESSDYKEAIENFEKIMSLKVSIPNELYYHYAKALMNNGDIIKAYENFEKYIQKTGRSGKNYQKALTFMIDLEDRVKKKRGDIKAQKEKIAQKKIVRAKKERSWMVVLPIVNDFVKEYPKILDITLTKNKNYLLSVGYTKSFSYDRDYYKILLYDKAGKVIKERKFDKSISSNFVPSCALSDGEEFIFLGSDAGYRNLEIAKLDKDFNTVWRKPIAKYSDKKRLIRASRDEFLVLSEREVIKIDKKANTIWKRSFDKFRPNDLKPTKSGDYILVGVKNDNLFLLRLDKSGKTIWQRGYGYRENRNFLKANPSGKNFQSGGNSITELDSGEFIIAGYASVYRNMYKGLWILCLDSSGNYRWDITSSPGKFHQGKKVIKCDKGGFAVASRDSKKIWVLKFNKDVKVLINRVFAGKDSLGKTYFGGLLETEDGGLIVGGGVLANNGVNTLTFLSKMDKNGK